MRNTAYFLFGLLYLSLQSCSVYKGRVKMDLSDFVEKEYIKKDPYDFPPDYYYTGVSKALIVSAILFSISHTGTDSGLLPAFLGGLFLGYIYLKSGHLYLVIMLHALYNLFNLVIFQNLFGLQNGDLLFMNTMNFNILIFIFLLGVFMNVISILKFKKM